MRVSVVAVWMVAVGGVLVGCAVPTLTVQAEPEDARVVIDGRVLGAGTVRHRQHYYGTARVEVVPAVRGPDAGQPEAAREPARRAVHRMVEIDPPVTRWLFPFDLLVEIATGDWQENDTRVELRAAEGPPLASGEHPETGLLRQRAERARTAR